MTPARLFSLICALGLLIAVPALAEDSGSTGDTLRQAIKTKRDATAAALQDFRNAREDQKLTKLIAFGDKSVDEREGAITEHEKALTSRGCSKTTQAAITTAFKAVATTLATEKGKIDDAKTMDDLKVKVKDVFQVNRVYLFLIPASRGACISQKLLDLINGKLADAVTKLKAVGIDTSAIEVKLASAKVAAQSALDTYLQVIKTPGGDDAGNKIKMAAAKTSLQNVRKILGDVKSDIGNLMGAYNQKSKGVTPSDKTTSPTTSSD